MHLTDEQKKAAGYHKGSLLIIAGAGTGKTTVLVEKIKYLLKKKLAKPEEILALTFTDKAAREMEERVDKAVPYGYFQMNIATFHAFCDEVLRNEAIHIGLSPSYRLYTQAESIIFLKNNLFLFDLKYFRPLGNPNKFLEGMIQHFSRLRDEDISPEEYIKWAKKTKRRVSSPGDPQTESLARLGGGTRQVPSPLMEKEIEIEKNLEMANAYKTFQTLKMRENVLDFADLIFYTLRLFRERPNILKNYQNQFKYILVDEFQDTNIAQYDLIKLLAPPDKNSPPAGRRTHLTVIGDDNQSIYKFRGAAVSNILQFMDEYNEAKNIVLVQNFRSNQSILDAAYKLIKYNDPDTLESKLQISKNLKSMIGSGNFKDVSFNLSERGENEAEYIKQEILGLKKKYDWRDFAILVRANNHADPFVRAFSRSGIPYQFLGPGALFKQPEIKDLIAYLNILCDINDSASLYRVLSTDIFDIDKKDFANLISFTKKTSASLFETIEIYLSFFYPELYKSEFELYKKYLFIIKKETREKLFQIYKLINKGLSLMKHDTAGQILYHFLENSGILTELMDHTNEKKERIALNISKFFDKLKTFETEQEDTSVTAAVDYITMSMELGESPLSQTIDWSDYDGVNILTAHSAKGLEFPVVFLVNLTQERFPTRARREQIPISEDLIKEILPQGDYHVEEERRLFYVGLTRAKDKVYLTASRYYGEAKRTRKLSPFVYETLDKKIIDRQLQQKKDEKAQLSFFDFKKNELPIKKEKKLVDTFSYSQLEAYKICPLRYKYQYILKIPIPANAAASFGETIHATFEKFYERFKNNEKPDLKTLLRLYEESWIPIGYHSKNYESKMKKEGVELLTRFYKQYHNSKLKIIDLEKWFKIKLDDDISIRGKIDRVDRTLDNKIEIVDYKTGKKPSPLELKKNLQLGIYALAAHDKGLFNKKFEDITLTFYFLQEDAKISMKKDKKELEKVKQEIGKIIQDINSGNFEPHVGPWCSFCPFRINCEAWQ